MSNPFADPGQETSPGQDTTADVFDIIGTIDATTALLEGGSPSDAGSPLAQSWGGPLVASRVERTKASSPASSVYSPEMNDPCNELDMADHQHEESGLLVQSRAAGSSQQATTSRGVVNVGSMGGYGGKWAGGFPAPLGPSSAETCSSSRVGGGGGARRREQAAGSSSGNDRDRGHTPDKLVYASGNGTTRRGG